jgi:hypothetical protein
MSSCLRTLACGLAVALGAVVPVRADAQAPPPVFDHVISANPFGLLFNFFNAEYERRISMTSTAGLGGSTLRLDGSRYVNADVFWRFYPGGTPFAGPTLGAKIGLTSVGGDTHFGYGFDANYSWLLGPDRGLYIGLGFGLKRLVGNEGETEGYIPTLRIVNIDRAF